MASRRATKPGTRRLSEVARKVVQPEGIVSTGWPDVARTCSTMGVEFDEWQHGAGRLILSKRADGLLSTTVGGVGMSLPRQVGKTYLLAGLTFALCVNNPGLLVIWTSHHLGTTGESFLAMQGFARRARVAPYVHKVYTGSGDEEIRFHNGSRILFGARERGFGRGIPGVDMLVFDEAQILSDKALEAMLATMNTSLVGLHLYIGTPPRAQELAAAESFSTMRRDAWSGDLTDSVWIECGADPGCDPDDRAQWAKANPSYPHRTPAQAFLRLRKKLTGDGGRGFLREGLGVWDETTAATAFGSSWAACLGAEPSGLPVGAYGVAASLDLSHAAVVAAYADADVTHVKPLRHEPGAAWVVDHLVSVVGKKPAPIVVDGTGPAAVLIPAMEAAGLNVVPAKSVDVLDACAGIVEKARAKSLRHASYAELDRAVDDAVQQPSGDRWKWARKPKKGEDVAPDITPLEAATLALWHLSQPSTTSVYESRGVLTI